MFSNLQPITSFYKLKLSRFFPPNHCKLEETQGGLSEITQTPITPTVSHGNKLAICVFLLRWRNKVSQWVHRGWRTCLGTVAESIWFISERNLQWLLHSKLCRRSWWLTPATSSHYTAWCPHVNTPPVTLPENTWQGARLTECVWACARVYLYLSVYSSVCLGACTWTLLGLDHCLHLCARVSAGCQLISESAHYQTLMQKGRGRGVEGRVRRRHFAHAVMEQWRPAELPPPLCQSIIILVFSQDSVSVSGPAMKFHGTTANTHSHVGKLALFCPGLSWHTGQFFRVTLPAKGDISRDRVKNMSSCFLATRPFYVKNNFKAAPWALLYVVYGECVTLRCAT